MDPHPPALLAAGCRDAARLERFVEVWEPLLPPAVLQLIMESLVLPRVRLAVQAWDPLRDAVALHTWVHPWLVSNGPRLGGCRGRARGRLLPPRLRERLRELPAAAPLWLPARWHPCLPAGGLMLAWRMPAVSTPPAERLLTLASLPCWRAPGTYS